MWTGPKTVGSVLPQTSPADLALLTYYWSKAEHWLAGWIWWNTAGSISDYSFMEDAGFPKRQFGFCQLYRTNSTGRLFWACLLINMHDAVLGLTSKVWPGEVGEESYSPYTSVYWGLPKQPNNWRVPAYKMLKWNKFISFIRCNESTLVILEFTSLANISFYFNRMKVLGSSRVFRWTTGEGRASLYLSTRTREAQSWTTGRNLGISFFILFPLPLDFLPAPHD